MAEDTRWFTDVLMNIELKRRMTRFVGQPDETDHRSRIADQIKADFHELDALRPLRTLVIARRLIVDGSNARDAIDAAKREK